MRMINITHFQTLLGNHSAKALNAKLMKLDIEKRLSPHQFRVLRPTRDFYTKRYVYDFVATEVVEALCNYNEKVKKHSRHKDWSEEIEAVKQLASMHGDIPNTTDEWDKVDYKPSGENWSYCPVKRIKSVKAKRKRREKFLRKWHKYTVKGLLWV